MPHAFRTLVINLLDDPHGIDEKTFNELVSFSARNHAEILLDDVWGAANGCDGRVYLDEDTAEELRKA